MKEFRDFTNVQRDDNCNKQVNKLAFLSVSQYMIKTF